MTVRWAHGPFAIVPEAVLDADVSDRAVRLFALLARYADQGGSSHPSRPTLARRLRCSVDSMDRAVRELTAAGFLARQHRTTDNGDSDTNEWLLMPGVAAPTRLPGLTDAATGSRTHAAQMRTSRNEKPLASPEAKPRRPRKPDPLWDAVISACKVDPASITNGARGAFNRAVADLRQVNAVPAQVRQRAAVHRVKWPNASLTPTSLARHWAELAPDRPDTTEIAVAQTWRPPTITPG